MPLSNYDILYGQDLNIVGGTVIYKHISSDSLCLTRHYLSVKENGQLLVIPVNQMWCHTVQYSIDQSNVLSELFTHPKLDLSK